MPAIGKNMISWFYACVEHIEFKTKTVNIIHFPYLDLSQNEYDNPSSATFNNCA
jgi:hypothetical protein